MTWISENKRWKDYEDFDLTEVVGQKDYQNNNKNMNGILKLSWGNVRSALVYGLVAGVVNAAIYAVGVGDVFNLNWHFLVNGFVFGVITSVLKNLFTTDSGNFVGVVSTTA